MPKTPPLTEDHIREAAYFLWKEADEPEGRDEEFWLQAEAALSAPAKARKPAAKKAATKPAAGKKAAAKKPATRKPAKAAAKPKDG